jgi:hypothetical protein
VPVVLPQALQATLHDLPVLRRPQQVTRAQLAAAQLLSDLADDRIWVCRQPPVPLLGRAPGHRVTPAG